MSLPLSVVLALLLSSTFAVASQTLFKHTSTLVTTHGEAVSFVGRFIELLQMPSFIFALVLYGLAFVVWVWLLSKDSLSVLYPIGLSLNVVLALASAHFFLSESISTTQIIGVCIIIAGIFIVAR